MFSICCMSNILRQLHHENSLPTVPHFSRLSPQSHQRHHPFLQNSYHSFRLLLFPFVAPRT
ncbi:hypothetical protein BGZ60DRAFT_413356 [Tricladium varicosporioides]|nr:hypothetical protein BGZ60DRAFT_413356 [Hymenoscyphus varicosporioides]